MNAERIVNMKESNHPRYSHRVIYPGEGGKRLDRFFTNETEALEFADKKREELGLMGTDFGSVREPERAALAFWRAFRTDHAELSPPALMDVLREAKAAWLASKGSVTVEDAKDAYIAHQEAGGASVRHLASLKSRLSRFESAFGKLKVSAITTTMFQDWLNTLRATREDKVGKRLTATTRMNLSRSLRSFFTFAEERGWTLKNPVPKPKRSKTNAEKLAIHKAPGILLPDEVQRFMKALKELAPGLVAFWALKFFAGVRDSETARLEWSMIDLEEGKIHLPARFSKTGEARSMKIEANLAAWLKPHAMAAGRIAPGETTRKRGFKRVIDHLSEKDDTGSITRPFVFPSNAARHCFGTFHLFHFRNAGETALQMGHKSNPAMLHEHYKNPTAEKHAADFWEIYPGKKPRKPHAPNVVPIKKTKPAAKRAAVAS